MEKRRYPMHQTYRRLIALTLCAGLITMAYSTQSEELWQVSYADPSVSSNDQAQIDDLNNQYEELEEQQKEIQAQINAAKSEKDKYLAEKNQLNGQIDNTQAQINVLTDKITLLDNMIAANNASIAGLEEEIDKDYEIFRQRARASYMSGDSSTISLLLGADSFSDFLMKADITARVAENDREIIAGLEANIAELEKLQQENEANTADLNDSKGTLDEKKQQLNGQVTQIQGQIEDIDALQKEYQANKAEIDKMMAQVQREINDIYASYESQGEYTGGVMTWPVPGYTGITSYYGWRFNNTDFHTGIDISGSNIYGRNIVAAADGVVIKAQQTYVQGVGYGRYLLIDHGGNISTLYGHTSQLLVSEGDHVTRGQAIAKVGSTGWSTGPHLHFEVRENGIAVNPLSGYLKP